jgi:hypothetical protein
MRGAGNIDLRPNNTVTEALMNKMSYAAVVMLSLLIIACGSSNNGAFAARSGQRQDAQQAERAAIVQRLIPAEAPLPANRLKDVLAAISMIDKGFELENPTRERVHRHLLDRELATLRRIEANVRAIERKRKNAGGD